MSGSVTQNLLGKLWNAIAGLGLIASLVFTLAPSSFFQAKANLMGMGGMMPMMGPSPMMGTMPMMASQFPMMGGVVPWMPHQMHQTGQWQQPGMTMMRPQYNPFYDPMFRASVRSQWNATRPMGSSYRVLTGSAAIQNRAYWDYGPRAMMGF